MSIQAKEEMYMNIAVTDDTEDERRDGGLVISRLEEDRSGMRICRMKR